VRERRLLERGHRERVLRRPADLPGRLGQVRRRPVRGQRRPGQPPAADRRRREDPGRPGHRPLGHLRPAVRPGSGDPSGSAGGSGTSATPDASDPSGLPDASPSTGTGSADGSSPDPTGTPTGDPGKGKDKGTGKDTGTGKGSGTGADKGADDTGKATGEDTDQGAGGATGPTGIETPKSDKSATPDIDGSQGVGGSPAATPDAGVVNNPQQAAGSWSLVDTGAVGAGGRHRGGSADESVTNGQNAAPSGRHASREPDTYTVREGDSLSSIADSLDVDGGWRALYAGNKKAIGTDPDRIAAGQTLDVQGETG
jgi:hypothetical protein